MTTFATLVNKGAQTSTAQPKMLLYNEQGDAIVVRRAPRITNHDGMVQVWEKSNRAGRTPVLRRTGTSLDTIGLQFYLGERDIYESVQPQLDAFIKLSKSKSRIFMVYSKVESGSFLITAFSFTINDRVPDTHEPSRVLIDATFTRLGPAQVQVGPVSGGVSVAPVPVTVKSSRTYTVKRGDTLWDISVAYYGSGILWRRIADVNGITDPRLLQIGTVLRIP